MKNRAIYYLISFFLLCATVNNTIMSAGAQPTLFHEDVLEPIEQTNVKSLRVKKQIQKTEKTEPQALAKQEGEMIIFIHGTLPPAQWRITDFIKILRDTIENSIYLLSANYIRQDPFFRTGQAMQAEGLHPIDLNSQSNCASTVARMYEQQYAWLAQRETTIPTNTSNITGDLNGLHSTKNKIQRFYYTFGWRGILHVYTRYDAAKELYRQLLSECKRLKNLGISEPIIRIVTFSHGGNIALNLAAVQNDTPEFLNKPLTVHELIMFATPVQKATDYLTKNPMFKKIYHFYSSHDTIQTMDFTCPDQWFSKRIFKKSKKFVLPESLTQVQIRITKKLEPRKKRFKLPELFDYLILENPHFRPVCDDPKHTEFWHFQWGSSVYRPKFALAPMPVCVFAPSIVAAIEHYTPNKPHLVFNFAPICDGALIIDKIENKNYALPFFNREKYAALSDIISPEERMQKLDIAEQKKHFNEALYKAERDYNATYPDTDKYVFARLTNLWKYIYV